MRFIVACGLLAASLTLVAPGHADAAARCRISVKIEAGGFPLSQTIRRARGANGVRPPAREACELRVGDEIVQIDAQPVEGQKARTVDGYLRALSDAAPRVFKVRREGRVTAILVP